MDASRDTSCIPPELSRYSRQILVEQVGIDGQRRLGEARVLLVGCGALGTVLASTLVRAGVGFVRLCDRDFIEPNNLQRQILFDEEDIAANLPKAEAAAAKLRKINSDVTVEAIVDDVNPTNLDRLAGDVSLVLDGTDNFETRFLLNDYAVKSGKPWIYGAVVGTTGLCMVILPHDTPCLRCVFENAPPPEMSPTCDTAGVLGPAVNLVASFQAVEAMKLLAGRHDQLNRSLMHIDAWTGRVSHMKVQAARDGGNCPCCKRGEFPYLDGKLSGTTTTLCGRDAVQVHPGAGLRVDFAAVAAKLEALAGDGVRFNRFMLRAMVETCEFTLFPDGRAIIKGTTDPKRARSLYARYVGA
jgi:adenylyltransferase/sulfurtransferase